ncbi:hypothetical protein DFH28DRAFT_926886 [Melampsora americana]|nr:hypothetical protein DFH28DRAFT_926886 [Melampsora americana]
MSHHIIVRVIPISIFRLFIYVHTFTSANQTPQTSTATIILVYVILGFEQVKLLRARLGGSDLCGVARCGSQTGLMGVAGVVFSQISLGWARLPDWSGGGVTSVWCCQLAEDTEEGLRVRWLDLVVRSRLTWSAGAQAEFVEAVLLNKDEEAELLLDLDGDNGDGRDGEDELFEIADEVDEEIVDEIDEDIGGVVDGA